MSVVESLERLGGVATRGALIAATDRIRVDRALEVGDIVVLARGRYALPEVDASRAAAHRLTGAVSWRSAAQLHHWELLRVPDRPEITVPANRKLTVAQRAGCRDPPRRPARVRGRRGRDHQGAHAGRLPARPAVRRGAGRGRLGAAARVLGAAALGLASGARGPGSAQMRRVASLASADKANPFESGSACDRRGGSGTARAAPGLDLRPGLPRPPDFVDERLKIVLEADSFEWHGSRAALRRDAARYDEFGVRGWLVLRFAWEDVMFEPAWVRSILAAAVAERSDRRCPTCRAA